MFSPSEDLTGPQDLCFLFHTLQAYLILLRIRRDIAIQSFHTVPLPLGVPVLWPAAPPALGSLSFGVPPPPQHCNSGVWLTTRNVMHGGISVILACIHPNRAVMQAPCMHAFMHLGMFYKSMHASEHVHIYEYLKGQFNEIFVFPVFFLLNGLFWCQ